MSCSNITRYLASHDRDSSSGLVPLAAIFRTLQIERIFSVQACCCRWDSYDGWFCGLPRSLTIQLVFLFVPLSWLVLMRLVAKKNNLSTNQLLARAVERYISESQVLEPVEVERILNDQVGKSVKQLSKTHKRALDELTHSHDLYEAVIMMAQLMILGIVNSNQKNSNFTLKKILMGITYIMISLI